MYTDNLIIKKQISMWLGFMFLLISVMIVVGGLTRLTGLRIVYN